MVHEHRVHVVVQVLDLQDLLDLRDARLGHGHLELRLLDLVVHVAGEPRRHARERLVPLRGVRDHAGDDQRRARLVDQDRVDLVHDREAIAALHALVQAHRHVVAQVVEPELVVRAVGDVRPVGRAPLRRRHVGLDQPDLQPEEPVDAAHPFGIALGEVVVDGDDVHALALERVEVAGERRDEGLALAGLHLRDVALVQRRPAHQLDVEVALADRAAGPLAGDRERLREQVVDVLAVVDALAELGGLAAQLVVREVFDLGLEGVHEARELLQVLELAAFAQIGQLVDDRHGRSFGFGSGFLSYPRSRGWPGRPRSSYSEPSRAPSRSTSRAFSA